jgi:hypothetical protein
MICRLSSRKPQLRWLSFCFPPPLGAECVICERGGTVTARIIVFIVAILFIHYIVNTGKAPGGYQVVGIQQIKQVFEQLGDGLDKLQRM